MDRDATDTPTDAAARDAKPVGHLVISFPQAEQAEAAQRDIQGMGLAADAVRRYDGPQMLQLTDAARASAGPLDRVGQEVNLLRARRELAGRGYHWLLVHAPQDTQAAQVAEAARRQGAERAQHYGNFIVEELIDRPGDLPQVGESPDRGLDAQTPSGLEAEAGRIKAEEDREDDRPQ